MIQELISNISVVTLSSLSLLTNCILSFDSIDSLFSIVTDNLVHLDHHQGIYLLIYNV
jgi:hypothetical protein